MQKEFRGGVHPSGRKELTENIAVSVMPAPKTVYISLSQHIGKPAKAIATVGQAVAEGELIATADGVVSSNIYSSVSGVVKAIEKRVTANGKGEHIVIEADDEGRKTRLEPLTEPTKEQILARVAEAGIVGLGGAGFPTAVKLNSPVPIDTLVINGAECEPYITCDYRIMLDYTASFIDGVRLIKDSLSVEKAYIGIEDNKEKAIAVLKDYLEQNGINDIEVKPLKTKYPQGAEKQLIYGVTGRKVPLGGLPTAVGVVVCNVHTALSVHFAVREGKPLYERIMTVTGEGITEPKNIWVANGTTYEAVIEYCGGLKEGVRVVKMLNGGPMMGVAVAGSQVACTKTTSCLLLMSDGEAFTGSPSQCINCGKCANACPMRLMPMYMDAYALSGELDNAVKYGLNACIECGSCTFVCPAKRTLVQSFRLAKKKLRGRK